MAKALPNPKENADDVDFLESGFEDITELQGDIDDTLSKIKSEFDADENDVTFFIKVYRVEPKTGKSSWLFNCQPEELPIMEKLRDSYGTGIYQVRVYKNQKLNRRFNYQIEAPKMVEKPVNQSGELAAVLKAMNDSQQRQFEQMKELMLQVAGANKPVAQNFDPFQMMTGMVAMLSQLKNLVPTTPQVDQTSLILKGMEIMKDFSAGGETTMMDVLRDLLKSPLLEKAIESTAVAIENTPQIPANKTAPQINAPQTNQGAKMNPVITGYVNTLVKKAAGGSNPELYAEFILDNVPENMVRQYIVRDDLMEFITKINPEAAKYPEWFAELKNCIVEFLTDEDGNGLTPEPGAEDTTQNGHESAHNPDANS